MLERLLIGVLGSWLPEEDLHPSNITYTINPEWASLHRPGKFHVAFLSLSLITGLAFGGFITYKCWLETEAFLSYIRNLVLALVCRTFFSILFEGVVILGDGLPSVGGSNALSSFVTITSALVIAFWLTLTIYLHAKVQRDFNSEPTLRLYQYGIPGVAVFFAMIWIIVMNTISPQFWWWLAFGSIFVTTVWLANSANLLFLLIQLCLTGDIVRMLKKTSADNDSTSLLWKLAIVMGSLILIFWFQFGFSVGESIISSSSGYLYFYYLIDGLQCGLVCVLLYFFQKWVVRSINISRINAGDEIDIGTSSRGILTVDSVFMTRESGSLSEVKTEESEDVVYSSVVQQQKLKKTLDLYKRLNVLPKNDVTVYKGETFFDCNKEHYVEETPKEVKREKQEEKVLKRNAFYSSKYLIIDSKEKDIPKVLETRPPPSSQGKNSPTDETNDFSGLNALNARDLLHKDFMEQRELINVKEESNVLSHTKQESNTEGESNVIQTGQSALLGQNSIFSKISKIIPQKEKPVEGVHKAEISKPSRIIFEENEMWQKRTQESNDDFSSSESETSSLGNLVTMLKHALLNAATVTEGKDNEERLTPRTSIPRREDSTAVENKSTSISSVEIISEEKRQPKQTSIETKGVLQDEDLQSSKHPKVIMLEEEQSPLKTTPRESKSSSISSSEIIPDEKKQPTSSKPTETKDVLQGEDLQSCSKSPKLIMLEGIQLQPKTSSKESESSSISSSEIIPEEKKTPTESKDILQGEDVQISIPSKTILEEEEEILLKTASKESESSSLSSEIIPEEKKTLTESKDILQGEDVQISIPSKTILEEEEEILLKTASKESESSPISSSKIIPEEKDEPQTEIKEEEPSNTTIFSIFKSAFKILGFAGRQSEKSLEENETQNQKLKCLQSQIPQLESQIRIEPEIIEYKNVEDYSDEIESDIEKVKLPALLQYGDFEYQSLIKDSEKGDTDEKDVTPRTKVPIEREEIFIYDDSITSFSSLSSWEEKEIQSEPPERIISEEKGDLKKGKKDEPESNKNVIESENQFLLCNYKEEQIEREASKINLRHTDISDTDESEMEKGNERLKVLKTNEDVKVNENHLGMNGTQNNKTAPKWMNMDNPKAQTNIMNYMCDSDTLESESEFDVEKRWRSSSNSSSEFSLNEYYARVINNKNKFITARQ